MNCKGSLSVVIATRNRPKLLTEAIDSIRSQVGADDELIVVDDSDVPANRVDLGRMEPLRCMCTILRSGASGPGNARNLGIGHARGDYIAILDDDDVCRPVRMASQRAILDQNPSIGMAFSSVAWFRGDREVFGYFPGVVRSGGFPTSPEEVFKLLYLESNKIPNTTIMARRSILLRTPYPTWPWIGEDWLFCMQLAACGVEIFPSAEDLVLVRRDNRHESLMQQRIVAHASQRCVLRVIRTWLEIRGDRRFGHLHRLAWANQLGREAAAISGLWGLGRGLRALCFYPGNLGNWSIVGRIVGRAVRRVGRF